MVSDGQGLMVHPIADYRALIRRGIPIASTAALIMPPVLVHRYTSDRAHQPLACAPYTQCSYRTPGLAKPLLCQSFSLSSEYEWQSKCSRRRMLKLSGKRDSSSKVGFIAWSLSARFKAPAAWASAMPPRLERKAYSKTQEVNLMDQRLARCSARAI